MEREILHLNVSHFSAVIEEICNPSLKGEPFVISPAASKRSVVMELSPKAFTEGIRKGMSMDEFKRRAPGINVIEPRYELYSRAGKALYKKSLPFSPTVEQISGGHIFIDLTGTKKLFGCSIDYAAKIKSEIRESLGIDPIAGLSSNRLVSKVATRIVKPQGFISVMPGDEANFLKHQDIKFLPGIGKKMASLMDILKIEEIGELAELPDSHITAAFGKKGFKIRDSAMGIDNTPVLTLTPERRKITETITLDDDTNDIEEIEQRLFSLVERTGMTLRQGNMVTGRIELSIRYCDSIKSNGGMDLPLLSFCDRDLFNSARILLKKIITRRVRIRYIKISLRKLHEGDIQLDLFTPDEKIKTESLQKSIDSIRERFGRDAVKNGLSMKWNI